MLLREQYQEHSERDYLSVPLATYHFEQVTIPLHWHREVELILPQEAGELELEEPEIIKQGGRYGVRLRAKAPSIHMIRADIQAEVSPIVGSEKQSEDMLGFLLQEFEGEPERIWQSNIFGRSFHELINEDLASKLKHMPEEARQKMQQTLEKIINEGSGGLICIIL